MISLYKRNLFTLALLLVLTVSACANLVNTARPVSNTDMPSPTVPPTALVTATASPQAIAPFNKDLSCWPITTLPKSEKIEGSFILAPSNSNSKPAFAWDISSFRTKSLETNVNLFPSLGQRTSPDGKFLVAIFPMKNNQLILTSIDQELSFMLPEDAGVIVQYLLNGKLLIPSTRNRNIHSENYKEGTGFTDKYYVVDPLTSDVESHSVFLPNFSVDTYGDFAINYSPDMRYVLYHSDLYAQGNHGGFTLLELTSNEIKWTVPAPNKPRGAGDAGQNMPVWRPDASSLTYIWPSNDEHSYQNFFSISLNGDMTQFTRFEQIFEEGYTLFSQPQWSPNMRYLMFRVQQYSSTADSASELFIWNDKEKKLLNPCLPNKSPSSSLPDYMYTSIWSFDSEHIQVSLDFEKGVFPDEPGSQPYLHYDVVSLILDIPNKTIFNFSDTNNTAEYYTSLYGNGLHSLVGWVNWEIP